MGSIDLNESVGAMPVCPYDVDVFVKGLSTVELFSVLSQSFELIDEVSEEVFRRVRIWLVNALKATIGSNDDLNDDFWVLELSGIYGEISNIILPSHGRVVSVIEEGLGIVLSTQNVDGTDVRCKLRFDSTTFDKAVFGERDFFDSDTDFQNISLIDLLKAGLNNEDLFLACDAEFCSRVGKFLTNNFHISDEEAKRLVAEWDISVMNRHVVIKDISVKDAQMFKPLFYLDINVFDTNDVVVFINLDYFEEVINV